MFTKGEIDFETMLRIKWLGTEVEKRKTFMTLGKT